METIGKTGLVSIVVALGASGAFGGRLILGVDSSCHSRMKRALSTTATTIIPTMSQSSIRTPAAIKSSARIPRTVIDRWNSVISLGTFMFYYVFSVKTRVGWA